MVVAAKELSVPHVSCFSHTLQLGIEDGLKINQIARVLGAARKLVAHFSHSVVATNALLEKQNDQSTKLKLIQDVPTRWNSSFLMLGRLLKLRIPVYSVIFDDSVTKPCDRIKLDLKDNFWKIIEDTVPILEPLADITEILGKEDIPTGSGVYILLNNIFKTVLCSNSEDSGVVKELKQKIREGLQKRFKLNERGEPIDDILSSPLLLASLLDPRYKSLLGREILASDQVDVFNLIVTDLMNSVSIDEGTQIKEEPETEVSQNPPKKSKFLEILQGDVVASTRSHNQRTAHEELHDYLTETVRIENPLKWWQINEGRYPKLAKLAKVYLAVPATSVPSERTFSVAGQTVSKLRASLDSESVDQIIFLNKNLKESVKQELQQIRDCVMSAKGSNNTDNETLVEPAVPIGLPEFHGQSEIPQVKQE